MDWYFFFYFKKTALIYASTFKSYEKMNQFFTHYILYRVFHEL
jgi:trehalose-6-phosphate synthase